MAVNEKAERLNDELESTCLRKKRFPAMSHEFFEDRELCLSSKN